MSNNTHRTQKKAQPAPPSARLVQLVAALGNGTGLDAHACFAERMGRLFDLSDTIALDAAYKYQSMGPFRPEEGLTERLRADFNQTRDTLLNGITLSFDPGDAKVKLRLPQTIETPPVFKPYERFYLSHQRQLITAIQYLRQRLRDGFTAQNHTLAQLAVLDTVFDNTLASYGRYCFGAIPMVLGKRFRSLWRAHRNQQQEDQPDPMDAWVAPGGWLHQFRQEMQTLLLAELETRLEPVQGLLDALNHEEPLPQ
ncbi:hypothetical protein MA04_02438 [Alcanivorax balearicus MACL04]|uniref:DUF3348 domain-containing protein n=1 Tax=Alloalcanivorax balearicus MACL04 TaxID=1177182 RepID=A0ABT2R023_9GAMM|nr:DUF3348 domain-containing protein [Alloalcanivorax balearicus]MCU5783138.1 hypothetical protein [Alloalcanivorax balearicus MACL04]